jgi:histidinol-phosphate aminotransferase
MTTTDRPALGARPDLSDLEPYVSPQLPARYRLNTNESPYPPPDAIVRDVADALRDVALNRYPDRDATSLYAALASHTGWRRDGLWIANGSNEVFLHLALTFGGPGRTSMTFEPTYSLHTSIPRIAGTSTVTVERDAELRIDPAAARVEIERARPSIVIVTSPNNPTGSLERRETIEELLALAPGIVVVDEAYIEFAPQGSSVVDLLSSHPNLVVTRTFSKAWRLAGVRIGYLMASPELVTEMARVRLPYGLSALTQVVGERALEHAGDTDDVVRSVVEERERLYGELEARGLHPIRSSANFVMFKVPEALSVWKALLERGVLVRNYEGVPLLADRLRVTAGTPEEVDAFLAALGEVLGD